MPGNADKHAPGLSILCCARRIHVLKGLHLPKIHRIPCRLVYVPRDES